MCSGTITHRPDARHGFSGHPPFLISCRILLLNVGALWLLKGLCFFLLLHIILALSKVHVMLWNSYPFVTHSSALNHVTVKEHLHLIKSAEMISRLLGM